MKKTINLVVSLALVLSSPAVFAMPDMSSAGDSVRLHHQKQETPQPSQTNSKRGWSKRDWGQIAFIGWGIGGTMLAKEIFDGSRSSGILGTAIFGIVAFGIWMWNIKLGTGDKKVKRLAEATERYAKNMATEDDLNVLTDFAKDVYIKDNLKEAEVASYDSRTFGQGGPSMVAHALYREQYKLSQSYASMSDAEKQDYVAYVTQTIEQLPSEMAKMQEKNPKTMFSYNALVTIIADVYGELKEPLAYSSK